MLSSANLALIEKRTTQGYNSIQNVEDNLEVKPKKNPRYSLVSPAIGFGIGVGSSFGYDLFLKRDALWSADNYKNGLELGFDTSQTKALLVNQIKEKQDEIKRLQAEIQAIKDKGPIINDVDIRNKQIIELNEACIENNKKFISSIEKMIADLYKKIVTDSYEKFKTENLKEAKLKFKKTSPIIIAGVTLVGIIAGVILDKIKNKKGE